MKYILTYLTLSVVLLGCGGTSHSPSSALIPVSSNTLFHKHKDVLNTSHIAAASVNEPTAQDVKAFAKANKLNYPDTKDVSSLLGKPAGTVWNVLGNNSKFYPVSEEKWNTDNEENNPYSQKRLELQKNWRSMFSQYRFKVPESVVDELYNNGKIFKPEILHPVIMHAFSNAHGGFKTVWIMLTLQAMEIFNNEAYKNYILYLENSSNFSTQYESNLLYNMWVMMDPYNQYKVLSYVKDPAKFYMTLLNIDKNIEKNNGSGKNPVSKFIETYYQSPLDTECNYYSYSNVPYKRYKTIKSILEQCNSGQLLDIISLGLDEKDGTFVDGKFVKVNDVYGAILAMDKGQFQVFGNFVNKENSVSDNDTTKKVRKFTRDIFSNLFKIAVELKEKISADILTVLIKYTFQELDVFGSYSQYQVDTMKAYKALILKNIKDTYQERSTNEEYRKVFKNLNMGYRKVLINEMFVYDKNKMYNVLKEGSVEQLSAYGIAIQDMLSQLSEDERWFLLKKINPSASVEGVGILTSSYRSLVPPSWENPNVQSLSDGK